MPGAATTLTLSTKMIKLVIQNQLYSDAPMEPADRESI
jgi:hypothetical protein